MFQRKKQNQPTKQTKLSADQPSAELTFLEHLYELRKRLFWVVAVLVLTSAVGFQVKDPLMDAVMSPLHGQKLIYLTPGGGFSFIFTLSLYFGVLFTIPAMMYHLFRFLQPIIGRTSRRVIATFLILSVVLASAGALFGYFVTIPAALNFLSTFAGDTVIPSLTAESYLNFVVTYIIGLALLFQLPLLLIIFDHVNPFQKGTLSGTQDKVIIGATVMAAVITPTPDAFNMALVAIPIVGVYEFGVFTVWIRSLHRQRSARRAARLGRSSIDIADEDMLSVIIEELTNKQTTMPASNSPATPAMSVIAQQDTEQDTQHEQQLEQIQVRVRAQPQPQVQPPSPQPVVAVASTPQPQSQPQTQPKQKVMAMDGFVRSPRPLPVTLQSRTVVPSRPVPQRSMPGRDITRRSFRSIDGFTAAA